jgi:formylglycine-generating enzyme required for sulfatase activity
MGRVYLCRDKRLDVEVAIKVLPVEFSHDQEALQQIAQEARASAKFREAPGILSLYGFHRHQDTWFLEMEYAGGGSLRDLLKEKGVLPEADVRRYGAEIAEALYFAHRKKVLHRDIKPANVLLNEEGAVKIADFGIAKVMAEASTRMSLQTVAGTPIYMAPEVILRTGTDARTDLYSLGCMLYELCTGKRPFDGSYPEVAMQKTTPGAKPPDPRDVRPELSEQFAAVVRRLLEPEKDGRFPDGRECAMALRGTGAAPLATQVRQDTIHPPLPAVDTPVAVRTDATVAPEETIAVPKRPLPGAGLERTMKDGELPSLQPTGATSPPPGKKGGGVLVGVVLLVLVGAAAAAGLHFFGGGGPDTGGGTPTALLVTSDPGGAAVLLDGVHRGTTPLQLDDLAAGKYTLRVERAGFISHEERADWDPTKERTISHALVRETVTLELKGGQPLATVHFTPADTDGRPSGPFEVILDGDGNGSREGTGTGVYRVTCEVRGHDPLDRTVTIGLGASAALDLRMEQKPGLLSVGSNPIGAEVLLDDRSLGRTPLARVEVPAGRHVLRLTMAQHEPATIETDVEGGETRDLGVVSLVPWPRLDLSQLGEGVTVLVDGRPAMHGDTLAPGDYEVVIRKPRHEDQVLTLQAIVEEPLKVVPGPWTPLPGSLDLSSLSAGVEAYLDGAPLDSGAKRAPGKYSVELRRPFHEPQVVTVEVMASGEVKITEGTWVPLKGRLDLAGLPEGTQALLDGAVVGQGHALEPGDHAVTLRREGYADQSVSVTVQPDRDVTVKADDWERRMGGLDFSGLPAGVQVTIDGRSVTTPSKVIELTPGRYEARLVREGYLPVDLSVSITVDQVEPLENPTWRIDVAVADLPAPSAKILEAQLSIKVPKGFVRTEEGRIYSLRDGAEMVYLPKTSFGMGGTEKDDQEPIHTVHLSPMLLDRHEVTVGQFRRFCEATGHDMPKGAGTEARLPVTGLEEDAMFAFCEWAGRRLPTEAEFERALRGGIKRKEFPWGGKTRPPKNFANYEAKMRWFAVIGGGRDHDYEDGHEGIAPVGSYAANALGLFDISGNVWEACLDRYDSEFYARAAKQDPVCTDGIGRVHRGGSFTTKSTRKLQCAHRRTKATDFSGFRAAIRLHE